MVVIRLYLNESIEILLTLVTILLTRRSLPLELSLSLAISWIRLVIFSILLDEDLAAIIFVSELLITHLYEHVIVHFVRSAALEFSGYPIWRGLG